MSLEPFVVPREGLEETVRGIVEPVVDDLGCELVDLVLVRGRERTKLRLFVDVKGGERIDLAVLEKVNRRLSDLLDVEDAHQGLFRGAWDLEVSSPGVDRPLAKRSHFAGAMGSRAKVRSRIAIDGARSHTGVIADVGDAGVTLATDDGAPVVVPWSSVESAHVIFDFGGPKSSPKPKRTGKAGPRP